MATASVDLSLTVAAQTSIPLYAEVPDQAKRSITLALIVPEPAGASIPVTLVVPEVP